MLSASEFHRYSRQILLPEFQTEGQEKLKQGSVLVIGAGGLGSPALYYLAAAGVGRIGIVDFDKVDESNLQRQILYKTADVGMSKAERAASRLRELNPQLEIETHVCLINSDNAFEIIEPYDIVIDGSDNLPTRYLVNDACVLLGKPLIYGAIFQFEGQASVFNQAGPNGKRGPNYRDLFPTPPPPEMVPSCGESGVLGVLPGIIGTMQANEAIKILAGMGETLSGRLLLFDSLDFSTQIITFKPDPKNPVSGDHPTLRELIDYEEFCNPGHTKRNEAINELSPSEIKELLTGNSTIQLIDVRDPLEVSFSSIGGINIPLKEIEFKAHLIHRDSQVVVYCKSGQRSRTAIAQLQRKFGYTNLINMKGGLLQWIDEVDSALPRY